MYFQGDSHYKPSLTSCSPSSSASRNLISNLREEPVEEPVEEIDDSEGYSDRLLKVPITLHGGMDAFPVYTIVASPATEPSGARMG